MYELLWDFIYAARGYYFMNIINETEVSKQVYITAQVGPLILYIGRAVYNRSRACANLKSSAIVSERYDALMMFIIGPINDSRPILLEMF